jgi:hypothetical protein
LRTKILTLNAEEQMFGLSHPKEMSLAKKNTYSIFKKIIHVPIVIVEDNFVMIHSTL